MYHRLQTFGENWWTMLGQNFEARWSSHLWHFDVSFSIWRMLILFFFIFFNSCRHHCLPVAPHSPFLRQTILQSIHKPVSLALTYSVMAKKTKTKTKHPHVEDHPNLLLLQAVSEMFGFSSGITSADHHFKTLFWKETANYKQLLPYVARLGLLIIVKSFKSL